MFLGEKLFSNEKNIKEKHLVLAVIKSVLTGFIRGKIETKAQFLAMKPKGFACVLCYYKGSLS